MATRWSRLPPGFTLTGSSQACAVAAMADEYRRFYAVQFHPEVTHTTQGAALLRASPTTSAVAARTGTCATTPARPIVAIRRQVGDDEVLLGLSGGVDSSVAAALIHKAIGERLTCVFVDHGLLRLNEADAGDGHVRTNLRRAASSWSMPAPSSSARLPGSKILERSARSSASSLSTCSSVNRQR